MDVLDTVTRYSYNHDIIFRIVRIEDEVFYLEGVFERLSANSPRSDLKLVDGDMLRNKKVKEETYEASLIKKVKKNHAYLFGKILHIDGDESYLKKCMKLYEMIGIYANGAHINEARLSDYIIELIEEYSPDIVVITGHDSYNNNGLKNIHNYTNSLNFYNAVKTIRRRYNKDELFVIAGACQSNFEALIASGCNFAMSKERVNIHALDPSIIAIKAATTPFNKIVYPRDIFNFTVIKKEGIGGIESYGKMRLIL